MFKHKGVHICNCFRSASGHLRSISSHVIGHVTALLGYLGKEVAELSTDYHLAVSTKVQTYYVGLLGTSGRVQLFAILSLNGPFFYTSLVDAANWSCGHKVVCACSYANPHIINND